MARQGAWEAPRSAIRVGREGKPRAAGAPPGGPGRPYRRESEAGRRERVNAAVVSGYGLEADPDDALPF